jgi:uncharacterized protein (DUF2384 family)
MSQNIFDIMTGGLRPTGVSINFRYNAGRYKNVRTVPDLARLRSMRQTWKQLTFPFRYGSPFGMGTVIDWRQLNGLCRNMVFSRRDDTGVIVMGNFPVYDTTGELDRPLPDLKSLGTIPFPDDLFERFKEQLSKGTPPGSMFVLDSLTDLNRGMFGIAGMEYKGKRKGVFSHGPYGIGDNLPKSAAESLAFKGLLRRAGIDPANPEDRPNIGQLARDMLERDKDLHSVAGLGYGGHFDIEGDMYRRGNPLRYWDEVSHFKPLDVVDIDHVSVFQDTDFTRQEKRKGPRGWRANSTPSGRQQTANPNTQRIRPPGSEQARDLAKKIHTAYFGEADENILKMDFSEIELRLAAQAAYTVTPPFEPNSRTRRYAKLIDRIVGRHLDKPYQHMPLSREMARRIASRAAQRIWGEALDVLTSRYEYAAWSASKSRWFNVGTIGHADYGNKPLSERVPFRKKFPF